MYLKIILLSILLLQSCKPRQSSNNSLKQTNYTQQRTIKAESKNLTKEDYYIEKMHTSEIHCDLEKKLVIKTMYIDIFDTISQYRPFILNQELIFYIEGEKVKSTTFPFNKRKVDLNGKPTEVFDTAICKIKCHNSEKGNWLYNIYGMNNFDSPHEFFGLISVKGEWLWYYYGDRYEIYRSYGNDEKYIEEYGEGLNSLKDMQQVCPN